VRSATRTISTCKPRLFFQLRQQKAIARAEPGNHGLELRCKAEAVAEVLTVRVVEAVAPEGVTVGGAKLHDTPEGKPVQLNETAEENEFCGVTRTDAAPLWPVVTFRVVGETVMLKVGREVEAMV
jgi:hypothetical protein